MARLTWRRVSATAIVVGVLSWAFGTLLDRQGSTPPPVPWTVPPILVTAAGAALWLGWLVRRYRQGKKPDLDPLQAARTAMFAQAAAYAGAALAGAYGGYAMALLPFWQHTPRREIVVAAVVSAVTAAVLCAAGWIAERWCDAGGDDGEQPPPSATAA